MRTQTNNYHCAKRTIISALHRRRNQIGRRFERPERVCKTTGSRRVQRPLADFAEPPQSKRCNLLRRNSAVFCARSVSTSVRSRRRCPADTFGATFLFPKGGKSAPCRRHPIGGAGCARNENRLFLQCDPAGRRPAKIQFRKIRSSAAAEERKPAAAHAEGGIAPPAASGTSSAGRGLTKGDRTLAAPRIFRLGKKQINLHCFRLFVSLACRRYFRSAMFE